MALPLPHRLLWMPLPSQLLPPPSPILPLATGFTTGIPVSTTLIIMETSIPALGPGPYYIWTALREYLLDLLR